MLLQLMSSSTHQRKAENFFEGQKMKNPLGLYFRKGHSWKSFFYRLGIGNEANAEMRPTMILIKALSTSNEGFRI